MDRRKRSVLEIYYEVLKALSNGPLNASSIMRKCNLDTRLFKLVVNTLVERKLISRENKTKLYIVTNRGLQFIKLYESLNLLLKVNKNSEAMHSKR